MLSVLPSVHAQQTAVHLDPSHTKIDFTLGATMHTVHGTFQLKRGDITFDKATGKAGGSIVLDATSGNTDNGSRDKKMHKEVLESGKFPEITFTPLRVNGSLASSGASQMEVAGIMRLHGAEHDFTLMISVTPQSDGRMDVATHFLVPYIQWGLKNPSTFVLRVSDHVDLDIHATALTGVVSPSGN